MGKAKVVRTENELRGIAKRAAMKAANAKLPTGKKVKISDIAVTWQCWILGCWKALLTVTVSGIDSYFEFTYDKSKDRAYFDEYELVSNDEIQLG